MKSIKHSTFFSITSLLISLACHADELKLPPLTTGKQLYEYHCSVCHQADGQGNPQLGYPSIRHTTLRSWQIRHKINGEGDQDKKMPTLKEISKSQAKLISDHIRTLK